MSDIAIEATSLGKSYRLARGGRPYRTLREDVVSWPRRLVGGWRTGAASHEIFWALRELSFAVKSGEVVGIIGRNGAGKSTLLKILSRITDPTTGGADVYGRVGSLLEVGTGFHPELTGRENIYLSGAMLGMRRDEIRRRFDEIVAFAEVEKFIDTPCKHYSSGMYTRLAFAVAAHLDAEILLIDEVLAVGDVAFRQKCLGKMGEVAQGGRTVLLVSHDLAAVRQLAHRCLWIDAGRIKQSGPSGEVIAQYLDSAQSQDGSGGSEVAFERGERPIWYAGASILGDSGPGMVRMGENFSVRFELRAESGYTTKAVRIAVGIRTEEGVNVALVADMDSAFELANGVGNSSHLTIRFREVRFYPGRYFLRLWIGGPDGLETFDDRPDCLALHVIDGGQMVQRRLQRHQGIFLLQPEWTVGKSGPETGKS